MKKLDNKGFLLVETLIVSVFVLTICVLLYRNGMPVIQEYEKRENYDDIDSVYIIDTLRKFMLSQDVDYIDQMKDDQYMVIKCDDLGTTICNEMNIEKIILSKWNLNFLVSDIEITGKEAASLDKGFKSYIRYTANTVMESDNNTYRLLIERKTSYNTGTANSLDYIYKYANIDYLGSSSK